MSPEQITSVAAQVVEALMERPVIASDKPLKAREVAEEFGHGYDWVLDNKLALGGYPTRAGTRPHWRFRRADVEAYFDGLGAAARAAAEKATPEPRQRAPRKAAESEIELLDFMPLRRAA